MSKGHCSKKVEGRVKSWEKQEQTRTVFARGLKVGELVDWYEN